MSGQKIENMKHVLYSKLLLSFENDNPVAFRPSYKTVVKSVKGLTNSLRSRLSNGVLLVQLWQLPSFLIFKFREKIRLVSICTYRNILYGLIFCQKGEWIDLLWLIPPNFWWLLFCKMNIFLWMYVSPK